jgi:electron transport complex protein RnfG
MAKTESTLKNMLITMIVITLTSAISLGVLHEVTKEPKRIAELIKQNFAMMRVLPAFDNDPTEDVFTIESYCGGESLLCYPAYKNGELIAVAVRTWTTQGFSGLIRIMVGFDTQGNIIDTSVLEHKETPGLGDKMSDAKFNSQYKMLNPSRVNIKVKQDGGTIDAITAATISARAFSDAIDRAFKSLEKEGTFVD